MAEDGAVIIDDVLGSARLEAIDNDLAPFLKEVYGRDAFTGFHTQRIGALIARSKACGELALEPRVLYAARPIWRSTATTCSCTLLLPWPLRRASQHRFSIGTGVSGVATCHGKSNAFQYHLGADTVYARERCHAGGGRLPPLG